MNHLFLGILLPFLGTAFGAGGVFFMKRTLRDKTTTALNGFAAGVMTAASVWSLLIPAIEQSRLLGKFAFLPAAAGLWCGIFFLLLLNKTIHKIGADVERYQNASFHSVILLALAVVLHNIPEGMAVGAAFAGARSAPERSAALALSVGIAIQNFPEGAIISIPLRGQKLSKWKSFVYGVLSGAVEPAAALLTLLFSRLIVPLLPCFLSFAAGAMLWVVAEDLLSKTEGAETDLACPLAFCAGFTVMMVLDVTLS